jgi:signal transduction histidine kinase
VLASRAALAVENHLYQQELISSERMAALGTMAGMLVHDFRGPMTVIRGYAEMLLETETDAEEVQTRARAIVEMVDRLDRMTSETLDFARGAERLALRSVNLLSVLDELVADICEQQAGLKVSRDLRIDPQLRVALDVDKLRRTVGNIGANAADAMRGRGKLHVSAWLDESPEDASPQLVLRLEDEGPGIPAEIRERLFDPFVTSGKKQGTGLGLAVAKRFVEDHGGRLVLLPEGPGARFQITLPLRLAAARRSEA